MSNPADEQFLRDHGFGFLGDRAVRNFPQGEFWTDPEHCDRETILKLIELMEDENECD